MKYLAIIRGYNERDNNTPSDEIWVSVIATDTPSVMARKIENEWQDTFNFNIEVELMPLEELKEWRKISEIW